LLRQGHAIAISWASVTSTMHSFATSIFSASSFRNSPETVPSDVLVAACIFCHFIIFWLCTASGSHLHWLNATCKSATLSMRMTWKCFMSQVKRCQS
jgi:hypothetical protein